jgi:aspartyl aminopeptidase
MIEAEKLLAEEISVEKVIDRVTTFLKQNPDKFWTGKEIASKLGNHADTILEETSKAKDTLQNMGIYRVRVGKRIFLGFVQKDEVRKKIAELLKSGK